MSLVWRTRKDPADAHRAPGSSARSAGSLSTSPRRRRRRQPRPAPGPGPSRRSRPPASSPEGIAIDGLDDSAWAVANDTSDSLRAPVRTGARGSRRRPTPARNSWPRKATGFKEYKLLNPRDKIFEGKFDLGRLEEALNYFARAGVGRQGDVHSPCEGVHRGLGGRARGAPREVTDLALADYATAALAYDRGLALTRSGRDVAFGGQSAAAETISRHDDREWIDGTW